MNELVIAVEVLDRVAQVLDRLATPRLTLRELQTAVLLASNPAPYALLARGMGISVITLAHHARAVFVKTGCRTRQALSIAVWSLLATGTVPVLRCPACGAPLQVRLEVAP